MKINKACLLLPTSSSCTFVQPIPISCTSNTSSYTCDPARAQPQRVARACLHTLGHKSGRSYRNWQVEDIHTRRRYASIAGDSSEHDLSHLKWPEAPRGHAHPTPYQIFALAESAPYSKQRFYELVKLYHPDRHGKDNNNDESARPIPILPTTHPCHNLAHSQKLERYRLVIAAHGILSDPAKRAAYDRFGAGWSGGPEAATATTAMYRSSRSGTNPGPFSGWREHTDPDIWANATWEDWERFHARRDPSHPNYQNPVYFKNSYFVTLILVLTLVGSSVNVGRAESNGEKFLEARDAMHDRASKELRKVRQQSESRAKDERIQFFIRQREATMLGIGVDEVMAERARKVLPVQESCMGDLDDKEWQTHKSGASKQMSRREG